MKPKSNLTRIITTLLLSLATQVHSETTLLADDFQDQVLDTNKWTATGNRVVEANAVIDVRNDTYASPGKLVSIPVPLRSRGIVTIRRRVNLNHRDQHLVAYCAFRFGSLPWAAVYYADHSYSDATWRELHGTYLGRNIAQDGGDWSFAINRSNAANMTGPFAVTWGTWFDEVISYSPETGNLRYSVNGQQLGEYAIGIMPSSSTATLQLAFLTWSWVTGNEQIFDDIQVTQDEVALRSLPDHQPDPADGRQAVKNFQMTPGGQCSFIFSTTDPGSMCLVSWSSNLRQWFPLIQFNTADKGTEIVDTPRDPSKFYRATYLPTGVSPADSFDYPIGSGNVAEQITPERNNLYPDGIPGGVRGQESGTGWHNVQDVGSFYSGNGLYHAGEDWNYGSGADDVGQQIHATANGVVMDVSHLNNASLATGGWAMVIRHYMLNGEAVDTVYVHIAPPFMGDGVTANSNGALGDKAWFPYHEGMAVPKGAVIAVVGTVQDYPTHLHFEIRNSSIANLPISDGLAAVSHYWPHAVGTSTYYSGFSEMQADGIVDPSDFIDDHR